jgi:hypothetical protein
MQIWCTEHRRAKPDADARLVHHVEHRCQAATGFAHEVTDRASAAARSKPPLAEVQQAVGGAAVSHLVIEPGQHDVVALAERYAGSGTGAGNADQVFRHDEQRDPLRAGNRFAIRSGDLRQHEVDDVLREIVLAGGNPHLVAAQAVLRAERRVLLELGARRYVGQRRPRLRLRQAHRSKEATREFRPHEGVNLRR